MLLLLLLFVTIFSAPPICIRFAALQKVSRLGLAAKIINVCRGISRARYQTVFVFAPHVAFRAPRTAGTKRQSADLQHALQRLTTANSEWPREPKRPAERYVFSRAGLLCHAPVMIMLVHQSEACELNGGRNTSNLSVKVISVSL